MSEATVTACYQHCMAKTALHVATAAMAGKQLGEEKKQEGRDADDGDDLADEKNYVHDDEVSVKCLLQLPHARYQHVYNTAAVYCEGCVFAQGCVRGDFVDTICSGSAVSFLPRKGANLTLI